MYSSLHQKRVEEEARSPEYRKRVIKNAFSKISSKKDEYIGKSKIYGKSEEKPAF